MSVSESIIVGESWIPEYYFTTGANSNSFRARVVDRRKAWDAEGAVKRPTARSRYLAARNDLEKQFSAFADVSDADQLLVATEQIAAQLETVLGYHAHGLVITRTAALARVAPAGMSETHPMVIIRAKPVETPEALLARDAPTLIEPTSASEDGESLESVARLLSALFVDDQGPRYALVLAGPWALVAEKDRWPEGRYLAVDLQSIGARNDVTRAGEIDRALTCLCAESLAPMGEGSIWWDETLKEAVKHTVGVSADLREGVRLSIELIANDVVRRRATSGIEPLPPVEAQPLAKQSLRFLYRVLFLLYAEASPELGVLPAGASEYDEGYSLDRLRELIQVELATPQALNGRHLYESLATLFRLVDKGNQPQRSSSASDVAESGEGDFERVSTGLTFDALKADLFSPAATAHIDAVGLGNATMQKVLGHLLLTKEAVGRDRGFISYAQLGINQLGAVYEGLMSYTGFFAETDLYEVAKNGDSAKGSWVVPVEQAEGISPADFVKVTDPLTGERRPVLHQRGTFVFRLAGRERQQSASYYTPEVLTRFTVGQAMEELLDQDGATTTAVDVLEMTVCEPALGSGAFAIEAVRQLAHQYLTRRQAELGERIDPDQYPARLQEVKAYIALHNVYGVDLNATAVELAEISLWLDTMVAGLSAPWFGLHLRRGNSLIGARRAVYSRHQVSSKTWLADVPRDVPVASIGKDIHDGTVGSDVTGGIHHFLLPADGWGAAADAKEAKGLADEAITRLKKWRGSVKSKPTKQQVDALVELAHRVETLWQFVLRRREIAEQQVRRAIPVWGAEPAAGGTVTRSEIETVLSDPNGAYQRLRRVMDAWCALWFWSLTEAGVTIDGAPGAVRAEPPTMDRWIAGLQALLGRAPEARRGAQKRNHTLAGSTGWAELGEAEGLDLAFAGVEPVARAVVEHSWLQVCERVAQRQGFFHWELDFATVFRRGGFDLQAGNPPWVRPRSDVSALLAEGDPWWQLTLRPTQAQIALRTPITLALPSVRDLVIDGVSEVACSAAFFGSAVQYPYSAGLQPDLYRCFMQRTWRSAALSGTVGLIHPESHFTDEKAGLLRSATYSRLRRHWQFINELTLFEIDHHVSYGVHVYSTPGSPSFSMASNLYHPDTVARSVAHDGSGLEPGLKDDGGHWDVRPHRDRILHVDTETLAAWHAVMESPSALVSHTRMVYAVNRSVADVLNRIAAAPRIQALGLSFSRGWDESIDRKAGRFDVEWGVAASWSDVILQGPHLHVGNPMYKVPNKTMLHNLDWTAVDLEALPADAIPATSYKPAGSRALYNAQYGHWGHEGESKPVRDLFRVAWRAMAANTGERTLITAVIPPGATHINGVFAVGGPQVDARTLSAVAAYSSTLLADFTVRVAPKSGIYRGVFERVPALLAAELSPDLLLRILRLNCLTRAYSPLWSEAFESSFASDRWAIPGARESLGVASTDWNPLVPLRKAEDRRRALVEIDALVALSLNITIDELCSIYRTQFAVLRGYDKNVYFYDTNGRLVPNPVLTVWRKKGDRISLEERTATNQAGNTYVYELPFATRDREADMRTAYAEFERRLAERS